MVHGGRRAQKQSLSTTPLKHFGPLRRGAGAVEEGGGAKATPFFEPVGMRWPNGLVYNNGGPHVASSAMSRCLHGGEGLTMERPFWHGLTPKKVPHRVCKPMRLFRPFRILHHHLMGVQLRRAVVCTVSRFAPAPTCSRLSSLYELADATWESLMAMAAKCPSPRHSVHPTSPTVCATKGCWTSPLQNLSPLWYRGVPKNCP